MALKVKDLMTKEPIVAEVPGRREDVLRLFLRHDVSGLPVVRSRTRELAGVVTRSDVFRKADEEQVALIMTSDPLTVAPDDDVDRAAALFAERAIHTLPVVDGAEVVGVLSPTDVLRTLGEDRTPIAERVRRTSPVHRATPIRVAWEVMRLNHENALPVLDDDGRLVGIVSDSDLFKKSEVDEDVRRETLGNAIEDDAWMWDRISSLMPLYHARSEVELPRLPVADVMQEDVVTVYHRATVGDVAERMTRRKVNQLPVLGPEDRLLGMITDLDLMAVKAKAPLAHRAA